MTDAEIYLRMPGFTTEGVVHPIRYWHGADDKNIPLSLVQRLCEILPHAELEVAEGLGHFSLAVLRAAAALDYLAERD
jgi:pimeloyl-ACP methyl ester carboxylesterase